jgi:PAS domain S-box-containing protein
VKSSQFSIQLRLAATFVTVLGILGLGLWLQERRDEQQGNLTREVLVKEQKVLLEKIIDLMGAPLRFFATDYAPWDDMVQFVSYPDFDWAATNIHGPLDNFKIEAVWVLTDSGTVIYGTRRSDDPTTPALPLPLSPAAVQTLVGQRESLHCFVMTELGLLELRAEPIRTAANINRPETGNGWLVAGELWDRERLDALAALVGGSVSFVPPGSPPATTDPRELQVILPLYDWQGQPLQRLAAIFSPPSLQNLENDRVADLTVFVLCGVAILLLLLVTTYRWIVRPMRLLAAGLAGRDPRPLAALVSSSREFHELGRNISRSFEQERELREAFDAFNAIDDAVFIVSASSHAISYVNAGALRLLGFSREAMLQTSFQHLVRTEAGSVSAPAPVSGDGFGVLHYGQVTHRDGQELEIEFRRQLLHTEETPTHYVVVARDISERRVQEKQRLRAQRLESLGALAGGVAHDLNNMLTPVFLLLDDLSDPQYRPNSDLVASVRVSVKRGASMLRQLLTFGRGIEGERKPIAIAELCADLGRIINSTFPKSINLELAVPADVGDVIGDATQLHQVLLNLCVNARDAMPDGGVLHIRATSLPIAAADLAQWPGAQPGSHVLLEVRDTGPGIPPELIDRIFEPFFTTKTPDKGTGLGLSTTLGIVRGHNGSITVESVPGRGTTFRVALPAVAGKRPAAGNPTTLEFKGDNRTVLVVEDEPLVLRTLLALLLQAGLKVVTAADGAAGLAVFAEHQQQVALVLTDISMAGTDGLEMVRRLRQIAPAVPVLVMSGRIDETQRQRMHELRLQHVINKPFTRAELLEAIRRALAQPPA